MGIRKPNKEILRIIDEKMAQVFDLLEQINNGLTIIEERELRKQNPKTK